MAAFSAGRPNASQPNGMQDVEPLSALQAGDDVANHVVADVADVRVPGGVREHLEAVELGLRLVDLDLEGAGFGPALLPLRLDDLGFVVRHDGLAVSRRAGPPLADSTRVLVERL